MLNFKLWNIPVTLGNGDSVSKTSFFHLLGKSESFLISIGLIENSRIAHTGLKHLLRREKNNKKNPFRLLSLNYLSWSSQFWVWPCCPGKLHLLLHFPKPVVLFWDQLPYIHVSVARTPISTWKQLVALSPLTWSATKEGKQYLIILSPSWLIPLWEAWTNPLTLVFTNHNSVNISSRRSFSHI